jgi:hypothetical protein
VCTIAISRVQVAVPDSLRSDPRPSVRPGRRLRIIGLSVLALGLIAAALVYRSDTRDVDPTVAELAAGSARARSRQNGILYGHVGVMMSEWDDELGQPGTQAGLILTMAGVVAVVCFRVAYLQGLQQNNP